MLRAVGGTVGAYSLGVTATKRASANQNRSRIGSRLFAEIALEHENVPDYCRVHHDEFVDYWTNPEETELTLTETISDEGR